MKIPNFLNLKAIQTEGDKSGHFTDEWRNTLTQLFTELQNKASDESLVVPPQPTPNLSKLALSKYKGGLVYDDTTNELKVNVYNSLTDTHEFKTIQVI